MRSQTGGVAVSAREHRLVRRRNPDGKWRRLFLSALADRRVGDREFDARGAAPDPGLNLNNAVFGFFNGAPGTEFSVQREYYGRAVIVGVKYGF